MSGPPSETPDEDVPAPVDTVSEHPLSRMIFAPLRTQAFANRSLVATAVAAILLVGVAMAVGGKYGDRLESLPGFYGLFGFIAFSLAVLCGWPLGRLLRRPESYYDSAERRDVE
jgi:hypothetical protein